MKKVAASAVWTFLLIAALGAFLVACAEAPPPVEIGPTVTLVAGVTPTPGPTVLSVDESRIAAEIRRRGPIDFGFACALPYTGWNPRMMMPEGVVADLQDLIQKRFERRGGYGWMKEWDNVLPGLEEEHQVITLDGPGYRPEFEGRVEFIPIMERGYCFLARADDDRFNEFEDILQPDIVFAAVKGTDGDYVLKNEYPEVELDSVKGKYAEDSIKEVLSGEADVTFAYSSAIPGILEVLPQLKAFPSDCQENPIWPAEWGIMVPKGDPVWRQWVQDLVDELSDSGWFEERLEHWSQPENLKPLIRTPSP